jgi:hypothetical protein
VCAITQQHIGFNELRIKRHVVLLHWIEQQRQLMHHAGNTTTASNGAQTTVEKRTAHGRAHLRKNVQNRSMTRVQELDPEPAGTGHSDVIPWQRKLRPRNAK